MTQQLLVLDADGVFLSERPYWEAALRAALEVNGVIVPPGDAWRAWIDTAIDRTGVHRITKRRGCNSNWDLAAVLATALQDQRTRERVGGHLATRQWLAATGMLGAAAEDLWYGADQSVGEGAPSDPLAGFGIDRNGAFFSEVRHAFQRAVFGDDGRTPPLFSRAGLRGEPERIRRILSVWRDAGWELAVCTGRIPSELLPPMEIFGLDQFFSPERLIHGDDVTAAEQRLGATTLGKPHWFSLVCAVCGVVDAEAAVQRGHVSLNGVERVVYVADGWADFLSVGGVRAVGLPVRYVHVRSGVTDVKQERQIAAADFTLAVIDELAEAPSVRTEAQREGRK